VRHPPTSVASLSEKDGWLTLFGGDATLDSPAPVFVGRRQQHERCRAAALVDLGDADEAGLSIRIDERSHYDIAVAVDRVFVRARIGPAASEIASGQRPAGESVLFIETRDGSVLGPPDIVVLGYVDDVGERQVLAELDGRYLSTEVAGGMLGRVIGMYAVGGSAAFDWFDYVAVED
jgi:xylan 1,4-beta-xylosidase